MGRPKFSGTELVNDLLFEMRRYVSTTDRKLAERKFNISEQTVSRYLNKKAGSHDLALDLIKFFKERIAARDEIAVWEPPLKSKKQVA
jgi:hypothetical protein